MPHPDADVYYQLAPSLSAALNTYPANISAAGILPGDWQQHGAACLHPSHRQARASPWCKLLGWWWAATQSHRHQWAIGLDTDAFIDEHSTPVNKFVPDFLLGRPYWGAPPGKEALTLFVDPGRADGSGLVYLRDPDALCTSRYANSGFVLARAGPDAEALLRRWWNVNDPIFALQHPYEQDAFGTLWRAGLGNVSSVVCCVDGGFFYSAIPRQWVRHYPGGFAMRERVAMIKDAAIAHGINATVFADLIAEMRTIGAVRALDQAALSADMASRTALEPGGGVFDSGCGGNQCRDEVASDPNFGVTPGLSKRTPPYVRRPQPAAP